MGSQVLVALGLSLLGGLSTSIGAFFVVMNPTPNLKMLGLLQGFAAGLMLSISFLDLAHNAINSIGFLKGNLWFFAGVIFFAVIANFIPEPTLAPISDVKNKKKSGDEGSKDMMKKRRKQVMFSGIITAIGISLHNFPEGMAVFLGSIKGLRVGLNLALAISLHNIPEGVAVALPVYFATESLPIPEQLKSRNSGGPSGSSWRGDGFSNIARNAAIGVRLCWTETSSEGRFLWNGFHVC